MAAAAARHAGVPAVRVYDPDAETRLSFDGVDAFEYAPDAVVEAVFTPYQAERTEQVLNANGTLQAVIADATSGVSTYMFRFLKIDAPDADGRTTVDFNRAYLPPCAFADHYACPLPPRGNRLPVPIEAGEKSVRRR